MSLQISATHNDNISELLRKFEDISDFLQSVNDPTFNHVKLRIMGHVMQDTAWLRMLSGNVQQFGPTGGGNSNPLVTNNSGEKMIMGMPVGGVRAPITKETLKPSVDDTKKFTAKVVDLYAAFPSMKDRDLTAILNKPDGEAVIRGVAKKAGVRAWEEGEVGFAFFGDIRQAMSSQAKGKAMNDALESKLAANEADNDQEDADEADETNEEETAPVVKKAVPKKVVKKK
jgi:hypothetical protein